MSLNESQTCRELIEPALKSVGWSWDAQLIIGPGKVNINQGSMYDAEQRIVADYLLRFFQMPLAILEAKSESEDAENGMQQGRRYAERLGLRFVIASNGHRWILIDRETGEYENLDAPPSPFELMERLGRRIDWDKWKSAFEIPWYVDQIAQKKVRPFQQMAIYETLCRFAGGQRRVLLLMATGTGKTFTVFQLVWKLIRGNALQNGRVLFLTDRNSLQDQAYRAFSAFPQDDRVVITKEAVQKGEHKVGKIFFANYQTLCEEYDGQEIYKQYGSDFFDLVIVDECHRSGFGDWFGVLEHFEGAYQLGLTATPRELEQANRTLTPEELRRDTYFYFTGDVNGSPAYTYSLRQAIEDGYLVPYLLEERFTNLDEFGFTAEDGRIYNTQHFEREIRLPERTRAIAEDLWRELVKHELEDEKTIVFCVDDTHAAVMAEEFRRLSRDENYAARITRSERNSHQLERNFSEVGKNKPRIAITVDLLTTGFDSPDVKNIVFARPVRSAILYKQMKGRGTRLCEDIDKRYFTIWDYAGASLLEDAEFDGHPANKQKGTLPAKKSSQPRRVEPVRKPIIQGVEVFISSNEKYVCLADGQKIQFDEYCEKSKEVVRSIATADIEELLRLWIDKKTRKEIRDELKDRDVYVQALRHYFELDEADDVDILAKVGFDLKTVPMRRDRKTRLVEVPLRFDNKTNLFVPDRDSILDELIRDIDEAKTDLRRRFWRTSLDHYSLYGIDDLERGETYNAPQFARQFGNFTNLLQEYGGAGKLKDDLENVKRQLYVKM
jgi:type I restriction enzyme, R subunit